MLLFTVSSENKEVTINTQMLYIKLRMKSVRSMVVHAMCNTDSKKKKEKITTVTVFKLLLH